MDEENLFKILILYFFFFFFFQSFPSITWKCMFESLVIIRESSSRKFLNSSRVRWKVFFFQRIHGDRTLARFSWAMCSTLLSFLFSCLWLTLFVISSVSQKKKKKQKEKPQFKNVYFLFFIHIQAKLKYRLREDINCWREILYCRDGSLCNLIRISCALRVNNNNNNI